MECLVQEIVKAGGIDRSYPQPSNKDCNHRVQYREYTVILHWDFIEVIHWTGFPSFSSEECTFTTIEAIDQLIDTLNTKKENNKNG